MLLAISLMASHCRSSVPAAATRGLPGRNGAAVEARRRRRRAHREATGNPAAAPVNPAASRNDAPLVALLVPLSGRQEALGTAVRDGFVAALIGAPASRRFNVMIIDEARVSAAEAHRQALDAGARALVGPLLKESVQALAPLAGQLAGPMPGQMPVLALNNLADTDPGAGGLWQFGLAPEDEAREIAARARPSASAARSCCCRPVSGASACWPPSPPSSPCGAASWWTRGRTCPARPISRYRSAAC